MKKFFGEVKETVGNGIAFLRGNKILLWAAVLLSVLSSGLLLINCQDILTDSEIYMMSPEGMMGTYNRVGRFGLTLTKKLFFTNGYTPFLFVLYMMITMCLVCLFFDFCVYTIMGKAARRQGERFGSCFWFCLAFNAIYLTSPILPHQFYFMYQAFEVSAAFLFCMAASFCAFSWVYEEKSPWWGFCSIGFMVWGFATYQVLVPYYIALNAMFFYLYYLFDQRERKTSAPVVCLRLIGLFLVGLTVYLLLNKGIALIKYPGISQGQLSDTYVEWQRQGVGQCLQNIKGDFHRVFFHETPAFHRLTLPVILVFLFLSFIFGKKRQKKAYVLFGVCSVGIILSMFLMTVLMGNYTILRAQLVYPLVFAFCSAALTAFPYKRKSFVYAAAFVLLFLTISQLKETQRFYTAMHMTAEEDKAMAEEIYQATAMYRDPSHPADMPMVFIGGRPTVELPANRVGWDALGMSFFYINYVDFQGTQRIYKFMNCLGLLTAEPYFEQYEYGLSLAESMTCWPAEGSVRCENGIICVKLSDLEPFS